MHFYLVNSKKSRTFAALFVLCMRTYICAWWNMQDKKNEINA